MLETGKLYRTRNGSKVRFIRTDMVGDLLFEVEHGGYSSKGGRSWYSGDTFWTHSTGSFFGGGGIHPMDVIDPVARRAKEQRGVVMIYVLFLINFDHYTFYKFISASSDKEALYKHCSHAHPVYPYDEHVEECAGHRGRTHYVIYEIEDGKKWEGCLG